jgi:flagellar hook-basal body complex protein FliE
MPTPAAAANAYAALARMGDQTASLGRDTTAPSVGPNFGSVLNDVVQSSNTTAPSVGPNFGSVLKDVVQSVNDLGRKSDVQAQAVALGKANMIDVVTAVAESETAIQTLVSVRDKVIAAYEDILKMPI